MGRMRNVLSLALLLSSTLLLTIPARAQSTDLATPVSIVFVIDNSGSMANTDPNQLRYAATRLIYEVADSNDEFSTICFGDQTAEITPLQLVGDTAARRSTINRVTINNCNAAGGTNMGAAVDEGLRRIGAATQQRRYIVLLTDGGPTDGEAVFQAAERARQQNVSLIPVAFSNGSPDGGLLDFQERMRQLRFEPIAVNSDQALIAEFARIYGGIKTDRTVTPLGLGEPSEMRVEALHQVNRIVFVLPFGQPILENDAELSCNAGGPRCVRDVEDKYDLFSVEGQSSIVSGIWRMRSAADNAVAITRSNFRPQLSYPPAEDTLQPAYYLPGRATQGIIADIAGTLDPAAPVSVNGDAGRRLPAPDRTFIFSSQPTLTNALIQLGTGNTPLVITKTFDLRPVPDPEGDLPRLRAANPTEQGAVMLANDSQFRLAVDLQGTPSLASRLTVRAALLDTGTNQVVFGPEALFADSGGTTYQSSQLIDITPGVPYRALFWMDAVRGRDSLRYGDLLLADFQASGGVVVNGLTNLQLVQFDGRSVPFTVDVTEANTAITLQAQLNWIEQPPGADAGRLFRIQLNQTQFSGQGIATSLLLQGPSDQCALPEGTYRGEIVFTNDRGLPVNPPRLDVQGEVQFGRVAVRTTEVVDLGLYCSLPGWLGALCTPVSGNEVPGSAQIALNAPSCVGVNSIVTDLDSIRPPDEGAQIIPVDIVRSGESVTLSVRMGTVPPIELLNDFAARRDFTGRLAIGRINTEPAARDVAQVQYAKFSTLDALTPWVPWLGREARWGNLIGLVLASIVTLTVIVGGWRGIFGETRQQRIDRSRMEERSAKQVSRLRDERDRDRAAQEERANRRRTSERREGERYNLDDERRVRNQERERVEAAQRRAERGARITRERDSDRERITFRRDRAERDEGQRDGRTRRTRDRRRD